MDLTQCGMRRVTLTFTIRTWHSFGSSCKTSTSSAIQTSWARPLSPCAVSVPAIDPCRWKMAGARNSTWRRCSSKYNSDRWRYSTKRSALVETGAFPWRVAGRKFCSRFPVTWTFCPCGLPLFQLRYCFNSCALLCIGSFSILNSFQISNFFKYFFKNFSFHSISFFKEFFSILNFFKFFLNFFQFQFFQFFNFNFFLIFSNFF